MKRSYSIFMIVCLLLGSGMFTCLTPARAEAVPAGTTDAIVKVTTFSIPYIQKTLVYGYNQVWDNRYPKEYADTWIKIEFDGQVKLNSSIDKAVQIQSFTDGFSPDRWCEITERNVMVTCTFSALWKNLIYHTPFDYAVYLYVVDNDPWAADHGDSVEFNPSTMTITEFWPSLVYLPVITR